MPTSQTLNGLCDSIHCGDAAFILKQLPSDSVDLIVTSPPYFRQRAYNGAGMTVGSERTVEDYLDSLMEVFDQVIRVTKPTGNIVYNIGDKYLKQSLFLVPFRFAIKAVESKDVRLVNNITWVKSNPTPRQFDRRLVSATEPFFHFAKTDNYYYNRDSFMQSNEHRQHHKPSKNLGGRYKELIASSHLTESEKRKANKALDEVIADVHSGKINGFRIKIRGIHAEAFGGQEGGRKTQINKQGFTVIRINGKAMKKDVIESPVENVPMVKHCAMFPARIIKELIVLLCPPGGVVLDPYVGSGTTAIAAVQKKCHYIGVDVDPVYCDIAEQRLANC